MVHHIDEKLLQLDGEKKQLKGQIKVLTQSLEETEVQFFLFCYCNDRSSFLRSLLFILSIYLLYSIGENESSSRDSTDAASWYYATQERTETAGRLQL